MANELSMAINVQSTKAGDRNQFVPGQIQRDQTGDDVHVTTYHPADDDWTDCGKGSIGNLGLCVIHNLGAASGDNVHVTMDGTNTHMTLLYGTWVQLWLAPGFTIANLGLKAATGKTPTVKVYLWEA